MSELGKEIRRIRESKDLSLRELARRISASPSFLSDIELKRRYPSVETLHDIADKLNTPYDVLRQLMLKDRPTIGYLKKELAEAQQENERLRELASIRLKNIMEGKTVFPLKEYCQRTLDELAALKEQIND